MFKSIPDIVPEGSKGVAKVEHFVVDNFNSRMSAIRREYVPEGKYARLYVSGRLMMSDTSMEHRTNWQIGSRANGNVLIAGLGLGMVLTSILDKEEVKSVTVIEKYQDVIDLISPNYKSDKLSIICADIFEWKPVKGTKYDVIYFDIWPDICTDNLDEISRLHNKFKFSLNRSNPNSWMDSWCKEELKYYKRRDSRYY